MQTVRTAGKVIWDYLRWKTMTTIKLNDDETIEITSTFKQSVKGFVREYDYNNQFEVKVKTADNNEISFDYHISIDETNKGKKVLTDSDHICAIDSFINDAISGNYSFEEFQDEYGYTNCKEAYKIWKLCQKALEQFSLLNFSMDFYELSNIIREKYPDVI